MGAGANAWAAAWGSSRERARWQEGGACVCVCGAGTGSELPLMFLRWRIKISVFLWRESCTLGCAFTRCLAGRVSPVSPGEHCKSRGGGGARCFSLQTATVPPWERAAPEWEALPSPCVLWGDGDGWEPLVGGG